MIDEIMNALNTDENRAKFESFLKVAGARLVPGASFATKEIRGSVSYEDQVLAFIFVGFCLGQVKQKLEPLGFKFKHASTGEERVVILSLKEVVGELEGSDLLQEKLCDEVCVCKPVGDMLDPECNCDAVEDFHLVEL